VSFNFVSDPKSGDYHVSMNEKNYEHWVLTKLQADVEEPSLIVVENASYHCLSGETSNSELEEGQDNYLAAREENYFSRGSFQS
jgi:hypothetical protein